jgi:hypothetical protein
MTHNYSQQDLKLASVQIKSYYADMPTAWATTRVTKCGSITETTKGKSLKLQTSWEARYQVVSWINDVVYMIKRNPRMRLMVVHLDWLTTHQGTTRDE